MAIEAIDTNTNSMSSSTTIGGGSGGPTSVSSIHPIHQNGDVDAVSYSSSLLSPLSYSHLFHPTYHPLPAPPPPPPTSGTSSCSSNTSISPWAMLLMSQFTNNNNTTINNNTNITSGGNGNCNINNNNNNAVMMYPDIIKMGFMKKLKKNKRKFFVLRLKEMSWQQAELSYWDNQKKFKEKLQPKRTIQLKDLFAVARIPDKKLFVLGIYTKEDLLACCVDDENTLIEWLQAIRFILYQLPSYNNRLIRDFHYIWQASISRVSSSLPKSLIGTYRLCLLPTVLHLIRVESSSNNNNNQTDNQTKHYEFPASTIHQCGHKDRYFYLQIGRLSELGAGQIWILTDDNFIAEHIHNKVTSFWNISNQPNHNQDSPITAITAAPNNTTAIPNYENDNSSIIYSTTSCCSNPNYSNNTGNGIGGSGGSSGSLGSQGSNSCQQSSSSLPYRQRSSSTSTAPPIPSTTCDNKSATLNRNRQHHSMYESNGPNPIVSHYLYYWYWLAQYQQFNNNVVNKSLNLTTNNSSSSTQQSPNTSRERLHSLGSCSRTASECSNEDLNSLAGSINGPPGGLGGNGGSYWDNSSSASTTISVIEQQQQQQYYFGAPSTSAPINHFHHPLHNHHSVECNNTGNNKPTSTSNSSLSAEYDLETSSLFSSMFHHGTISTNNGIGGNIGPLFDSNSHIHQHHSYTISTSNDASNSNSNAERGFGADYATYQQQYQQQQMFNNNLLPYLLNPGVANNGGSNGGFCQSCFNTLCLQMFQHQQQHYQHHYRSSSGSGSSGHHSTHQSPVTSPKCHCSSCLLQPTSCSGCFYQTAVAAAAAAMGNGNTNPNNSNNHHYLPTIPAGEPSDYVQMKPGENQQSNQEQEPEQEEEDEDSYLNMAPLSPKTFNNKDQDDKSQKEEKQEKEEEKSQLKQVRSYITDNNDKSTKPPETNNEQGGGFGVGGDDDSIFNGLTRAYSTGSKPQPLAPSIGAQCTNAPPNSTTTAGVSKTTTSGVTGKHKQSITIGRSNNHQKTESISESSTNTAAPSPPTTNNTSHQNTIRNRASSTGSHGMKFRAFLHRRKQQQQQPGLFPLKPQQQKMASPTAEVFRCTCGHQQQLMASHHHQQMLQQQPPPQLQCSTSASNCSLTELATTNNNATNGGPLHQLVCNHKTNKAASAPILSSLIQPRVRSFTVGNRPISIQQQQQQASNKQQSMGNLSFPLPFPPLPTDPNNIYAIAAIAAAAYCGHMGHGHMPPVPPVPVVPPSTLHSISPPGNNNNSANTVPAPIPTVEEGDLMELDFSVKKDKCHNKTTTETTNSRSHKLSITETETEGNNHRRKYSTSSSGTATSEHQRKRSDSGGGTSLVGSLFHHNHHHNNDHYQNKLDHLVNTFKNTLSLNGGGSSFGSGSATKKQPEPEEEEEPEYMLLKPGQQKTKTKQSTEKEVNKLTKQNVRSNHYTINSAPLATDEADDDLTLITENSKIGGNSSLLDDNDDDDDEPSDYVMMAPENISNSSNSHGNGSHHHNNQSNINNNNNAILISGFFKNSKSSMKSLFKKKR